MAHVICATCEAPFEAGTTPLCPACLAARWHDTPDLVRPKHDPAVSVPHERYRSVVSSAFLRRRRELLDHASRHGAWYFDRHYGGYVHYTPTPLGIAPGVGIPAGRSQPEHALDSLLIAEADTTPHVFAVDRARMEAQIRVGEFVALDACGAADCTNLQVPGRTLCVVHESPPAARAGA